MPYFPFKDTFLEHGFLQVKYSNLVFETIGPYEFPLLVSKTKNSRCGGEVISYHQLLYIPNENPSWMTYAAIFSSLGLRGKKRRDWLEP